MKKLDYNSVTITLSENDQVKEAAFPKINGTIVGLSTHLIGGERHGKRVRLALREGGNETHRPLDVAFTETSGRASFTDSTLALYIDNPGAITAQLQLDAPLTSNENIKVEVVLKSINEEIC